MTSRTVETHITNILNKLGQGSRIQLSRWATGSGEPTLTATKEQP